MPKFRALVEKCFLEFLESNFDDVDDAATHDDVRPSSPASYSTSLPSSFSRPAFFIAASHARGKVVFDPFEFVSDAALTSVLAQRRLECKVVTVSEPHRVRDNALFVLDVRRC